jgi:hypothetical protein
LSEKLINLSMGFSVLMFCCLVFPVHAASTWSQTYGGQSYDAVESLVRSSDGGYLLAGVWNSSFAEDAWLVKTDSSGNMQWNKTYGGAEQDAAFALAATSDGGYAIAGRTGSFGVGDSDFWLVKINGTGSTEWSGTYGGKDDDYASSLVATSDTGYALAGTWNYTTYIPGGAPFPVIHGDFWLVKTGASGAMQWNKTYGGNGDDGANALIVTSDVGFALLGHTRSFGAGFDDFWLLKTDALGNVQWNKTYGGTLADIGISLVETSDGGYAIVGTTMSFGAGGPDFWLIRTDGSGNLLWNKTYGGTGNDLASSVIATSDGGFALIGQTSSFGAGHSDIWLVKTDGLGNAQWNKTYGGASDDVGISLTAASDGGYVIAGNTASFGFAGDFWLMKTDEVGTIPEFTSLLIPALVMTTAMFIVINKKLFRKYSQ